MTGGFVYLLHATAKQWFFYDDWDFIKEGAGTRPWEPFTPHNGHPSLLPKLLYDALYAIVGLHHYWPYMVFVLAAHVLVAELLRRVLVRSGVGYLVALAAAGLVILLGAGWENITWAFQVGFVGALACGFGALLRLDAKCPGKGRRIAATVLLILSLQLSSVGAVMLVAATTWAALRGRLRQDAWVLAVPAVLYVAWLVVERGSLGPTGSSSALSAVPRAIWNDTSGAYATVTANTALGILFALVVFGLLVRGLLSHRRNMALPLACAVASAAFLAVVTIERTTIGLSQGTESRYVYVVVVLTLPLLLAGVFRASWVRGRPAVAVAIGAVVVAVADYNYQDLNQWIDHWTAVKQEQRSRVLATAVLLSDGDRPLVDDPDPVGFPQLQWEDVQRFMLQRSLPDVTGIAPGDILTAREFLDIRVTLGRADVPGSGPLLLTDAAGAAPSQNLDGCLHHVGATGSSSARLRAHLEGPTAFSLQNLRSLDVLLVDDHDAALRAVARHVDVPAGATVFVTTRLSGYDLVLEVTDGATLCNVRS